MARVHTCNILQRTSSGHRYWRFQTSSNSARQVADIKGLPNDSLPLNHVVKGWNTLFRNTVNVAWMPIDRVFLRVLQIPKCENDEELRTMVEFQLERVSPLPTAQVVWSFEKLPHLPGALETMHTVVVLLASRGVVEQYLGVLEAKGYQPDRLELAFLHELLNTPIETDGVWIYPFSAGDRNFCLAAFWMNRTLRSIGLVNLSEKERWGRELKTEIERLSWAGELEGWLTDIGHLHLVTDEAAAAFWKPAIESETGKNVEVIQPLAPEALAHLNAERLARGRSNANLLPPDTGFKYRQLVTDRIWMTGLGVAMLCYLFLVVAYFGWVQFLVFQKNQVQLKIDGLEGSFKEVQRMKVQKLVQEEQISLRYAALDGWWAVSEVLPTEITLTSLSFSRGNELSLTGTVPLAQQTKVTDFNDALSKVTLEGRPVFKSVAPPALRQVPGQGAPVMQFDFSCEMNGPKI